MLFFDLEALKPTGNNLKKFSLRMSMVKHQVWKQTSCIEVIVQLNTSSLLWDWPTVKDMDILFYALGIVFMIQTNQYL